jgi:hypothetical protein
MWCVKPDDAFIWNATVVEHRPLPADDAFRSSSEKSPGWHRIRAKDVAVACDY